MTDTEQSRADAAYLAAEYPLDEVRHWADGAMSRLARLADALPDGPARHRAVFARSLMDSARSLVRQAYDALAGDIGEASARAELREDEGEPEIPF